jgi:regulator of nucleoside diphosphate kinase
MTSAAGKAPIQERTIVVTARDLARLREIIGGAHGPDAMDRPYLASLRDALRRAEEVLPEQIAPDVVTMNSRVRLRDGRRTWTLTLVFPEDADAESGKISVLAPLGAAVLGRKIGERVEFRVPGGARSCTLLGVVYQPEAAGDMEL